MLYHRRTKQQAVQLSIIVVFMFLSMLLSILIPMFFGSPPPLGM